jgi:hypothetical protein
MYTLYIGEVTRFSAYFKQKLIDEVDSSYHDNSIIVYSTPEDVVYDEFY